MRTTYLVLIALLAAPACARRPTEDPSAPLPAALLPAPGATGLTKVVFPGHVSEVHYTLTVAYPASDVIADIKRRVKAAGFAPELEDLYNPGLRTGTGWGSYLDHSRTPHAAMHQWSAWWSNAAGDHIGYVLWYRTSPHSGALAPAVPGTTSLEVSGQFLTKSAAAQLRSRLPKRTKRGA